MVPAAGSTCMIFTTSLRWPATVEAPVSAAIFALRPSRESEPISRMLNGLPESTGSSVDTLTLGIWSKRHCA